MILNFEEFVQSSSHNLWIREPGISMYVRKAHYMIGGRPIVRRRHVDFDLANMDADEPGKGALTRFLDKYEPSYGFFVECIHNRRLVDYLLRRGYAFVGSEREFAPSMKKEKAHGKDNGSRHHGD